MSLVRKIKNRMNQRLRYERLKAAGLCVYCTQPACKGKTLCPKCSSQVNEFQARKRRANGTPQKTLGGMAEIRDVCVENGVVRIKVVTCTLAKVRKYSIFLTAQGALDLAGRMVTLAGDLNGNAGRFGEAEKESGHRPDGGVQGGRGNGAGDEKAQI